MFLPQTAFGRHCLSCLVLCITVVTLPAERTIAQPSITESVFQKHDRVAWLGGRLWELMQEYGDLEAQLAIRLPHLALTFRNCAWSGDDVSGRARAVFGSAEDGYQRRLEDLKKANPTLVCIAYGQSEAIDGWELPFFTQQFERLLQDLKKSGYRVIVFQPSLIPTGTAFPAARRSIVNQRIERIRHTIATISNSEGCTVLEFPQLQSSWTQDGLQPHPAGFQQLAAKIAEVLAPQPNESGHPDAAQLEKVKIDVTNPVSHRVHDWHLSYLSRDESTWRWVEQFSTLPTNSRVAFDEQGRRKLRPRELTILGLPPGRYRLSILGDTVGEASSEQWQSGVAISGFGIDLQRQRLQEAIEEKDRQFMHAYRPQNETYLFLFRKHEQGNNAGEAARFEQLARESDLKIQTLASPQTHVWELIRVDEQK